MIGSVDPLGHPESVARVAETGAALFGLELIPRITRAQSMDVLSSMATIAGYRAVLLGALELPKPKAEDSFDSRAEGAQGQVGRCHARLQAPCWVVPQTLCVDRSLLYNCSWKA